MNEMGLDWIPYLTLGTALVSLILFIIVIVQGAGLRKLRHRYDKLMNGAGIDNLEGLLTKMNVDIEGLQLSNEHHQTIIEAMNRKLQNQVAHVGVLRYNAFNERGSDLSFSIALLNDQEDGVVFTGIHGREHMFVYAKPLEKGNSTYALSPEEKQAMETARQHMAKS
ncbi:DUF4446 family protein [Paenibacillus marinisediminis]